MKDNKLTYEGNWVIFYPSNGFDISFEICGYFDNRPRIRLTLFFFTLIIILPFRNSWTDECDAPKWGIAYHNETLWIHRGGKGNMNGGNKWWTFSAPWRMEWVRTSKLKKDGLWEHSVRKNEKNFWQDEWADILWSETHPYTYILRDGTVQQHNATIKVCEMEWRWHWFKRLPITKRVKKYIDIEFDEEVGERAGSWKGGTIGCSYELKANETPLQCLRRMEIEREFK